MRLLAGWMLLPVLASAGSLDLDRALEIAGERNPDLLAARQNLEIARGRLVRARYWNPFNPEVQGGIASRQFDGGGAAEQRSAGASIQLEVAGQRGLRIDEAERNLERVEAEVADVERRILADVARAFHRVLYLRRRVRLFERIEELDERLVEISAEQFEAGEIPKLDANLAAIHHARHHREVVRARSDHENGVRRLERLLGRNPEGKLRPAGALDVPEHSIDTDRLVALAIERRPDMAALERERERIVAETRLQRRSVVPDPTLSFGYTEEAESRGQRDQVFGGRVSVPLPVIDRNQDDLASLGGRRTQVSHQLRASRLRIREEVRTAVRSFQAAHEAVAIFDREASHLLDESFHFVETAYREGKIDLPAFITLENDLLESRLSYLSAVRDYWHARVTLEEAVGMSLDDAIQTRGGTP